MPLSDRIRGSARAGAVLVEFAIVGPVFLMMMMFVFEIAYDLFLQEVLESALAVTARQMQIGATQDAAATGAGSFTAAYFCPNSFGFLNCNNLYVRVEVLNTSQTSSCADVYQATTGGLPLSGGAPATLQLAAFTSTLGAGIGGTAAATPCDPAAQTGYCNPGSDEFVLLTAIYVAPSFLNGMLPNTAIYTYGGHDVRAQLASTAFQTEYFADDKLRPSPC
jgi:Flp pilus assembly protein TadG